MKKIVFILLLLSFSLMFSQSKIDSLLQIVSTTKGDSIKIDTYIKLCLEYARTDASISLNYAIKAEELSLKNGFELSFANSKYRKASLLRDLGQYSKSDIALNEALKIYIKLDDLKGITSVKVEQANILHNQSRLEEATELYIDALPYTIKSGDKNTEARIHNLLGSIYKSLKQTDKAIEHYKIALTLVKELKFKPGISAILTNLGAVDFEDNDYERAEKYLKEALALKRELGDKLGESRVLSNMARIQVNKKEYALSESNYFKANILAIEVKNKQQLSVTGYGLAEAAFLREDYKQCIQLCNALLPTLIELNKLEISIAIYEFLSKSYSKLEDYKNAFDFAEMHNKLSDSLYNKNIIEISNTLDVKYQNKQKIKEIALLEKDNRLKALNLRQGEVERNVIIAFTVFAFLLVLLFINLYRVKRNANNKIKDLDRLKSNFFTNISHEFRTPLTLIKGPIEQLEQNPHERLSTENVKMIRRNSNRLLRLVNQLLDLSKADEGSLHLESTEGDVYKSLRIITSSFNSHAAQREIDYRVNIPQTDLWTSFDRDKLEKIVYNLLSNAFKFSHDTATITCTVVHESNNLTLTVSDSGRGISKDLLPQIFDRFYQVDTNDMIREEGSGIGLSIAKEFVDLMDGTLTVSSEINKGTRFTVQLPLEEIKTKQTIVSTKPLPIINKSSKQTFEFSKPDKRDLPTILLVEDNKDMRSYIREHLIDFYKITDAVDGSMGLAEAINNPPDLIITDLMMPKMDGLELCRKLKTTLITSHIPVIVLTSKVGMENKIAGLETGADDYLTKPFNANELRARVKNLLEQRKNLQKLYRNNTTQIDPKAITVTSLDQKFLEDILFLLEQKFSEPNFSISQMQDALAMSKTQLHRKLKAVTNEAPSELLRNFRLKRAAQLLKQDADNISQIAYAVGFSNISYFTKCFKELYGKTPSSFALSTQE